MEHKIFYEPAFYSLRFFDIGIYLSEVPSLLGDSAFQVFIYDKDDDL